MGAGINLSYSPCLESGFKVNNFGLSAKLQYNFTDAFRGELLTGYDFKDKEIGMFHVSGNFHYLINVGEKMKIYPIVGVGYAHMDYGLWGDISDSFYDFDDDYGYYDGDYDSGSASKNKLLVNAGLGAEYAITDHLSVGIEAKFQYIKDFKRLPISLGFTYKF